MKELTSLDLLGDNVLIDQDPIKTLTDSGIHLLTDPEQGKSKWGTVVKVGDEVEKINEGDSVLLAGFNGGVLELDGKDYLIAMSKHIVAVKRKK